MGISVGGDGLLSKGGILSGLFTEDFQKELAKDIKARAGNVAKLVTKQRSVGPEFKELMLLMEKSNKEKANQRRPPTLEESFTDTIMMMDALDRNESCGGHFREEYASAEGEAKRNDEDFAYVAAWEWTGDPGQAKLHKEELEFNDIELKQRSYK